MITNKKGEFGREALTMTLGIVFIIVIIAIGAKIVREFGSNDAFYLDTYIDNETFTPSQSAYVNLARDNIVVNSETVYNDSGGILHPNNYSMDWNLGQIKCVDLTESTFWCNATNANNGLNITYTSRSYEAGFNATLAGEESMLTLSNYMGILVIVLIFTLIIGLLTAYFMKGL